LATFRNAEFGFFGVRVITCTQTPRRWGLLLRAGDFDFTASFLRLFLTSWLMVGIWQIRFNPYHPGIKKPLWQLNPLPPDAGERGLYYFSQSTQDIFPETRKPRFPGKIDKEVSMISACCIINAITVGQISDLPAALLCVRTISRARKKLRVESDDFSCYARPCDRWSLAQFFVAPEESPNTKRQHASRKRGNLGPKSQMTDSITENIPPRTIFGRSETRN